MLNTLRRAVIVFLVAFIKSLVDRVVLRVVHAGAREVWATSRWGS